MAHTYCTDVVMDMDGRKRAVVHTTVTSSAHHVVLFLREIRERFREEIKERRFLIIGLDTEWRKKRHPGPGHPAAGGRYEVAVLQLCVGGRCLVFQVAHADDVPAELVDFLANPDFCFAGVGIGGDAQRLFEDCKLEVANTMELPHVAALVHGRPELRQAGLKALALEVMSMRMEKPKKVTMSNWAARHLSREQVRYACIDAFVSYGVGRKLSDDFRPSIARLQLQPFLNRKGTTRIVFGTNVKLEYM